MQREYSREWKLTSYKHGRQNILIHKTLEIFFSPPPPPYHAPHLIVKRTMSERGEKKFTLHFFFLSNISIGKQEKRQLLQKPRFGKREEEEQTN